MQCKPASPTLPLRAILVVPNSQAINSGTIIPLGVFFISKRSMCFPCLFTIIFQVKIVKHRGFTIFSDSLPSLLLGAPSTSRFCRRPRPRSSPSSRAVPKKKKKKKKKNPPCPSFSFLKRRKKQVPPCWSFSSSSYPTSRRCPSR